MDELPLVWMHLSHNIDKKTSVCLSTVACIGSSPNISKTATFAVLSGKCWILRKVGRWNVSSSSISVFEHIACSRPYVSRGSMYAFQSFTLTVGCNPFRPCMPEEVRAYRALLAFVMLFLTVSVVLPSDVRRNPRCASYSVISSGVLSIFQQPLTWRSRRHPALHMNARVFFVLNWYLSHAASWAAMLIMACRLMGDDDSSVMSSAQVGTPTSTVPIAKPSWLCSRRFSSESPLTLNNSVEGMPPCRTPCVSSNSVEYAPSHLTVELMPLYRSL